MAPLSLYDVTIPQMIHTLKALSSILKKAEDHTTTKHLPASDILDAKLAPDMYSLPFQIQTACNTAKFTAVRVGGVPNLEMKDDEKSFAELQDRITRTVEFLEKNVSREDFEGAEDKEVVMKVPGNEFKFTGQKYVNSFALPNFYFHVVAAYSILRMKGVEIGKFDYLGRQKTQQ